MKIFLPFKKDRNSYLDEIEHYFNGEFIYGGLDDYSKAYKIVHIHWPEAIFNWKEPDENDLEYLKNKLIEWKKHALIVHTFHDEKNHYSDAAVYKDLFKIVLENSDAFIHLGNYSKSKLEKKYPDKAHIVIYHPIYSLIIDNVDKLQARSKLGIDSNQKVILVFGNIRRYDEYRLMIKSFKKLKLKNKLLLIPRMNLFAKNPFASKLNKYIKYFLKFYFKLHPFYKFDYHFVNEEDVSKYFNAGDVVYIPRIDNLNSGIIFLAMTFHKPFIAPYVNNMKEVIDMFHYPSFDPHQINSATKALKNIVNNPVKVNQSTLNSFQPKYIAEQHHTFYNSLLNNK